MIKSILYELQPCRLKDIVNFVSYVKLCSRQLSFAVYSLFVYTGKSSFENMNQKSLIFGLKSLLWLAGWWSSNKLEFGSMYIIVSLFLAIFLNLGNKKAGEMSAYSVFNDGFQQLLGTMTAEQFDNEIRHRQVNEDLDDWDANDDQQRNDRPHAQNRNHARKKGKKARRGYEERLRKREEIRRNMEEAFAVPDGFEDDFEDIVEHNNQE